MNKTEIKGIFEFVKDHLEYFGFYPYDVATFTDEGDEKEIEIYPNYLKLFTMKQNIELEKIFYNHPEYKEFKNA